MTKFGLLRRCLTTRPRSTRTARSSWTQTTGSEPTGKYFLSSPLQIIILSSLSTGGIEILAQKGKIKVDNTLEARLDMIAKQILPSIRTKLFGANPSRSSLSHIQPLSFN